MNPNNPIEPKTGKTYGYYTNTIDLAEVRAAKPKTIYYGARTCWWTHDPRHLGRHRSGLPCDPRGGLLFETDDVEGFLRATEEEARKPPEVCQYGKHRLRAFMAAHHLNCHVSATDWRSTCFTSWDDYNRILDEADRGDS
ncbi:MAG: hypothetical protein ABIH03_08330 [Pseudomonadota bacterium]